MNFKKLTSYTFILCARPDLESEMHVHEYQ